ncbi:MAG: DNA primase [Christensenellales bacterium]|jgi:DNA primase
MAFYPEHWLQELRDNNDIVDIINDYTLLKPKGTSHWGCCPFHTEKTPSFKVDAQKQLYHCFGCKKGGNVITFVMDMERLNFPEAVEFLAKRAHMELPHLDDHDEAVEQKKKRDRIYEINTAAARFFHEQLHVSKNALEYLAKRGYTKGTIKRFGIGFAPDSWDDLWRHLKTLGYSDAEVLSADLALQGKKGPIDRFRNRVMFPIINPYNRVIAFGGRVMGDEQPKYINSRDTLVYHKGRNLYGLNYVDRKTPGLKMIVVEGYTDVISLYQSAKLHAVASLGTALTREQAHLMKRYSLQAYIAYDGDAAGESANLRGLETLSKEGMGVRVVQFEKGQDPDEFVRTHGREGFIKAMEKALPLMEYKLSIMAKGYDLKDQQQKMAYLIAAAAEVAKLNNPIEHEGYARFLQNKTGFTMETIWAQITRKPMPEQNRIGNKRDTKLEQQGVVTADMKARSYALSAAASSKEGFLELAAHNITFDDPFQQRLFDTMRSVAQGEGAYTPAAVMVLLDKEDAERMARLVSEYPTENDEAFLHQNLQTIQKTRLQSQISILAQQAEQEKDRTAQNRLLQQIEELNQRYRALK